MLFIIKICAHKGQSIVLVQLNCVAWNHHVDVVKIFLNLHLASVEVKKLVACMAPCEFL